MCKRTNGHEIKFILSAIHRDHHDICVTMYRWNSVKNGTKRNFDFLSEGKDFRTVLSQCLRASF